MRIDKYLANMNVGSRKEVHQLIKKGIVAVNDVIVKTPKQQVKESDQVTVNGDAVAYQKYHYFLLNKPKGVLSATEDRNQPTVISLLAPGKHVDKVYRAEIAGVANDATVKTFASGMTLGDGTKLQPAELKILSQDEEHDRSTTEIKICEGKYHQIKRMFGAVGMKVVELERISMGKLSLPANLKRGEYLELKLEDIVG